MGLNVVQGNSSNYLCSRLSLLTFRICCSNEMPFAAIDMACNAAATGTPPSTALINSPMFILRSRMSTYDRAIWRLLFLAA